MYQSKSASKAVTKRNADSALMPPPPPPKRIKRPSKVLEEDTYNSGLAHIIARDFFPDLLESETLEEYLDALDTGDADWIEEAGRKAKEVMTPVPGQRRGRRGVSLTPRSEFKADGSVMLTPEDWRGATPTTRATPTPATEFETPVAGREEDKVDTSLGLTAFQARYTSEDNESFYALLDRQNAKRAEKYAWIFHNNRLPSKRRIAQEATKQKQVISASSLSGEAGKTESTALVPRPSEDQDERPAMISAATTHRNPKNGLMFVPEDMESTHAHLPSRAQTAAVQSNAPPKSVSYYNTRLPASELSSQQNEDAIPPSPSISAIDAAIRGQPHPSNVSTAASSIADSGSETPRVNGYNFVDAEPTPAELAAAASSHHNETSARLTARDHEDILDMIRARGEPSVSRHGADGEPAGSDGGFKFNETSKRENLHHAMVEKTAKAKRAPAKLGRLDELRATPVPRFASSPGISILKGRGENGAQSAGQGDASRVGNMSPAGRALYSQLGKGKVKAGEGLFGNGEKKGGTFTPTPLRIKRTA